MRRPLCNGSELVMGSETAGADINPLGGAVNVYRGLLHVRELTGLRAAL